MILTGGVMENNQKQENVKDNLVNINFRVRDNKIHVIFDKEISILSFTKEQMLDIGKQMIELMASMEAVERESGDATNIQQP